MKIELYGGFHFFPFVSATASVITSVPANITVLQGDRAVLNCSAEGESVKFVWHTKPNREVVQDGKEDRIMIMENGPLVFDTVKKEDEGFYQCSVEFQDSKMIKTTNTHWAFLRVQGR